MEKQRLPGLVELIGMEERDLGPGEVLCRLVTTPAHQNIQGVIHGSVPVMLMDTAMGHAMDGLLEPGQFCSTTQFSVQFLKGVRPGTTLEAIGKVARRGRRIAYLDGVCTDDEGDVVARAHGTWYVGTIRQPGDASPRPDARPA